MSKGARLKAERKAAAARPMTRTERRALKREIDRQCARNSNEFFRVESAVILYALHEIFGFGKVRLHRFFVNYAKCHKRLVAWYEMSAEEDGHDIGKYLSILQLEKIGVDFNQWEEDLDKEMRNWKP